MDAVAWDRRYEATDLVWGREPNRWLAQEATGLRPGRALDLGAGEGRNALWLAGQGWTVAAVDFSAVAIDRGRTIARAAPAAVADRVRWVTADLLDHRPAPAAFDLVVVCYLHLPGVDRRRVLRRAATAVAPGGLLLVIGHHRDNITDGVGGPQDPAILFTPADIVADLADGTGLVPERADRVLRPVAVDGNERHAVDAVVRLRSPQPVSVSGRKPDR
jgi:SAM-dependent methyltransferase